MPEKGRFSGNVVDLKPGIRRTGKLTAKLRKELEEELFVQMGDKWLELLFEAGVSQKEMAREIHSIFYPPRARSRSRRKRLEGKGSPRKVKRR